MRHSCDADKYSCATFAILEFTDPTLKLLCSFVNQRSFADLLATLLTRTYEKIAQRRCTSPHQGHECFDFFQQS